MRATRGAFVRKADLSKVILLIVTKAILRNADEPSRVKKSCCKSARGDGAEPVAMAQKNSYAAMFKDAETEWGRGNAGDTSASRVTAWVANCLVTICKCWP